MEQQPKKPEIVIFVSNTNGFLVKTSLKGEILHDFGKIHQYLLNSMQIVNNSIYTCSNDKVFKQIDLSTNSIVKEHPNLLKEAFQGKPYFKIFAPENLLFAYDDIGFLKIYSLENLELIEDLGRPFNKAIKSITFSTDCAYLLSSFGELMEYNIPQRAFQENRKVDRGESGNGDYCFDHIDSKGSNLIVSDMNGDLSKVKLGSETCFEKFNQERVSYGRIYKDLETIEQKSNGLLVYKILCTDKYIFTANSYVDVRQYSVEDGKEGKLLCHFGHITQNPIKSMKSVDNQS